MNWIKITESNKPTKPGKYMCFVPSCKRYNKHYDTYFWNGKNFVDDTFMGRNMIVEASHFMIMEEPTD